MLNIGTINKVEAWAVKHAQEYLRGGEVCLTSLEEAILVEFDLEEVDFEEADLSFRIFKKLTQEGLLAN